MFVTLSTIQIKMKWIKLNKVRKHKVATSPSKFEYWFIILWNFSPFYRKEFMLVSDEINKNISTIYLLSHAN
jgi:hypothetical protein